MGKTNYNKVENAVDKGLHDLKVKKLLRQADEAQGKETKADQGKEKLTPKQVMIIIEQELKWMYKQDKNIYKILKLKRKTVDDLLDLVKSPDKELTKDKIEEIESLRGSVESLKKSKFSPKSDEECLKSEIDKHIYKRHNAKEKWLPLDTHSDWDKYTPKS